MCQVLIIYGSEVCRRGKIILMEWLKGEQVKEVDVLFYAEAAQSWHFLEIGK